MKFLQTSIQNSLYNKMNKKSKMKRTEHSLNKCKTNFPLYFISQKTVFTIKDGDWRHHLLILSR